ncbi:hypothetical protein A2303_05590 [Candidatus Falkowbacteria bacterium RIFOXYB2_FULL_47_14]|uniref:Uncharacterized protein n=1 Tax=Candidatus Falkowbacteria bacterium RIFOXYA2_FULL_47_19 TaxID=1797994 RepID=A0A1F5SEN8_9BACT|nr:MAG: hypothetical protein A2227_06990 [Candidatus Falkowbacteria bacterium RIFOXYA2_FULL_47_19]OGF35319.1 MAG: hypothetical protein A2468_00145 [Candidatus Falkowbacteria bacterium RIFOXYC2_FULL_46_15]OGF43758.1 MAG: hypothetical protein A2303_05590 [Candidatus Falkowbacteria bacterium RIFOXYB2_FULL_47_14]
MFNEAIAAFPANGVRGNYKIYAFKRVRQSNTIDLRAYGRKFRAGLPLDRAYSGSGKIVQRGKDFPRAVKFVFRVFTEKTSVSWSRAKTAPESRAQHPKYSSTVRE